MVPSNIGDIDCCYQSGTPPAFRVFAAGVTCSQQFGYIAPEVKLVISPSRWWNMRRRTVDDPRVHHGDFQQEPEDVAPPLLRRPPNLVVGAELIGEIHTTHVLVVIPNRRRLQLRRVSNGNHLSVAVGGQHSNLAFVLPDGEYCCWNCTSPRCFSFSFFAPAGSPRRFSISVQQEYVPRRSKSSVNLGLAKNRSK